MSVSYKGIIWGRQIVRYDLLALLGCVGVALVMIVVTAIRDPSITAETLLLRSTALIATLLLHVILCIGPMARLCPRLLPLLYNRRHLGVAMFLFALVHGALATLQFHGFGDANPLVSILTAYDRDFTSLVHAPFEAFGLLALMILFVMAATSHDFWLKTLGAGLWKALHLLVYVAWAAVVIHVALGLMQHDRSPVIPLLLGLGVVVITSLHLLAWRQERRFDRAAGAAATPSDGLIDVAAEDDLRLGEVMPVVVDGQRLALCRHDDGYHALDGVCRHQGGPLAEGKIIDGCLTCPWHGWQYQPGDGTSPPPFEEVVATYPVQIRDGRVLVDPNPNPLATPAGTQVPTTEESPA